MIKIGCASYSYRKYLEDGRMSYEDFVEEAYRIGLDGVEFTLYWLPSKDPIYLRKLRRLSLLRGLSVSCAGISTDFCSPDFSDRRRVIQLVIEGLDLACELGAPCLRVFAGYIPKGYSLEDATTWTVESLKSCASYAEDKGIVIAIENHGGITATANNVVKIVEGVNSPWVKVNLDLGNYKESTYEEVAQTVPYAVHLHGKVSVAEGVKLNYERIKEILEDLGYNGFLSIEYEEREDAKTGVPEFAKFLLNLFR